MLKIKYKDFIFCSNANSFWKKFNKKLKNKPINIDAIEILINLTKKFSLKKNSSLFFKNKNNNIELNQDDIDVAIGIIINPISLK